MTLAEAIAKSPVFVDYPGSKCQEYVWKRIVSRMPAHKQYVELFAGSAAVARNKKPADQNYLIEGNHRIAQELMKCSWMVGPDYFVYCMDALTWLNRSSGHLDETTLIYADPPYPFIVRSQMAKIYEMEFGTEEEHRALIFALQGCGARVMLSGYRCEFYDRLLQSWHREDYVTATRGGPVTESLWTNFDPAGLTKHDTRFIGSNFRDRHRIKRKAARWKAKFQKLPDDERQAVYEAMMSLGLV